MKNTSKYKLTKYGYYKNIKIIKLPSFVGYIKNRNIIDLSFYKNRKNILRRDLQRSILPIVFKAKQRFLEELRILDIGCGDGVVLEAIHDIARTEKIKIDLFGIDPVQLAFKDIRVPVKLTKGVSENMPFSDDFFHIVISSQMIEHLTEVQTLRTNKEVYRVLKKGGFYYIETPNPESVLTKSMKDQWYMFLPDHLILYPPRVLLQLLISIGFKNIKTGTRYEKDEQINEIQDAFMRLFPHIKSIKLASLGAFFLKEYITIFNKGAITTVLVQK